MIEKVEYINVWWDRSPRGSMVCRRGRLWLDSIRLSLLLQSVGQRTRCAQTRQASNGRTCPSAQTPSFCLKTSVRGPLNTFESDTFSDVLMRAWISAHAEIQAMTNLLAPPVTRLTEETLQVTQLIVGKPVGNRVLYLSVLSRGSSVHRLA